MPPPVLEIRTAMAGQLLTLIANDGFEVNTTDWSVAAGINGAATSITRVTAQQYMGVASGELVTTATSGSGVKHVITGTFTSGVAYRFGVYLKSISGSTAALIRIGSLGTVGDRASATMTLTTGWVRYTVDWTPSANRTDVQVNITNNAAAIATFVIDDAEVFIVSEDLTPKAARLSFATGLNFEGGFAAGSATMTLRNETKAYSVGAGRIKPGHQIYIRATYAGVTYGLFYGTVKRLALNPSDRTVDIFVDEISAAWATVGEVSIAASVSRSIATFRGLILDAMGLTSRQRSLSLGEAEGDIPLTGADQVSAVNLLAAIDKSTATVGYLAHDPQPSVLYVYTTLPRNARGQQALAETVTDGYTGIGLSVDDTHMVTVQRVNTTGYAQVAGSLVWESTEVPIEVEAATTRTIWATLSGPTLSQVTTSVGTASVTSTPFSRSAKLVIGPGTVTELSITGTTLVGAALSATYDNATTPAAASPAIEAEYLPSVAAAAGLAEFTVRESALFDGAGKPRGDITLVNRFPTQVARRLAQRVNIDPALVYSAYDVTIEAISTDIDLGANRWTTTWRVGPPGATDVGTFILGTSVLGGAHILGV